ncbi:hypothetical protein GCM10022296_00020 [Secundilactobacillus similis DSM 23365 = JCM 2765]
MLQSLNALFRALVIAVLEPKRVPQGRELHVSHFHHKLPNPEFLAKATYAPLSKRPVPHSVTLPDTPDTIRKVQYDYY